MVQRVFNTRKRAALQRKISQCLTQSITPRRTLSRSHKWQKFSISNTRQAATERDEWHGPNPTGNGAGNDGFILFEDGNAWDRKDDTRYKSKEVAEFAGIESNEYAPCVDFAAPNGHASKPSNGPPKAQAPKVTAKPKAPFSWKKATISPYRDETGTLLFEVGRCDAKGCEKSIRQRRPDGNGGWIDNVPTDVRRVLWHLRDVMEAQTVFIVEGEKCATALNEALNAAGKYGDFVATTSPQGKGKLGQVERH